MGQSISREDIEEIEHNLKKSSKEFINIAIITCLILLYFYILNNYHDF